MAAELEQQIELERKQRDTLAAERDKLSGEVRLTVFLRVYGFV
jgi:hypothetical protein